MGSPERGLVPFPVKEAEYLQLRCFSDEHYFEFLLIHDYLRLVVRGIEAGKMGIPLDESLPDDLPLLCALRVLVLEEFLPGVLTGRTFPKLERCRVDTIDIWDAGILPGETNMPVCTRVDTND